MRRAGELLATLCVLAFVVTLYGCGGQSGTKGGTAGTAGKPPSPPSHVSYTVTDMGTFRPFEINAAAQVAGATQSSNTAAIWAGGAVTDLGLTPASCGMGINDTGTVVGYWRDSSNTVRAFVRQGGQTTRLDPVVGPPASGAEGVNNSLQVVGNSYQDNFSLPEDSHACLWKKDASGSWTVADLGALTGYAFSQAAAINSAGQVAGAVKNPGGQLQAALWSAGGFTVLGTLGGTLSEAFALSDAGRVVGWSRVADGKAHAFLWQGAGMQDLGTLDCTYNQSEAWDINDAATPQIVGDSYYYRPRPSPGAYIYRACLWEGGRVYDLNNYLVPDGNTWVLKGAGIINDAGQIVAGGTCNGTDYRTCLLTPKK